MRPRAPEDGVDFRVRAREPSRLEGFSDAIFGFAITLLVVSLEVPRTFTELMVTLRGFPAFAVTFFFLFSLWYAQYRWFRRYPLHDVVAMILHASLLFVVLLFVYPLKFVATLVVGAMMGFDQTVKLSDGRVVEPVAPGQSQAMMTVYGLGYVAIFVIFALLHLHAWSKRRQLELDELEVADTAAHVRENALNAMVGVASIVVARLTGSAGWAGLTYLLIGPVLTVHGTWTGVRRRRLEDKLQPRTASP